MEISRLFESQWNFPNCYGAMDGKHIVIKQPRNSGSYFFNHKGSFSLVLLGLVDANDKFIYVDVAFPLRTNLMKPYPFRNLSHDKRVFNYRLSRARRIVENAFGILAQRLRVFLSPIQVAPENVEKITLASCALHNYLREKSPLR